MAIIAIFLKRISLKNSLCVQFFCDHISYMFKTFLQYWSQVHSVPKGLYKKIMYGLSHYAVLEKLPIAENNSGSLYPTIPYTLWYACIYIQEQKNNKKKTRRENIAGGSVESSREFLS